MLQFRDRRPYLMCIYKSVLRSELWFLVYLFHYKDRSILFPDLCSNKDCDFWERILSLNSHVSLFYLLFHSLFYIHVVVVVVVVVVHQGWCTWTVEKKIQFFKTRSFLGAQKEAPRPHPFKGVLFFYMHVSCIV